MNLFKLSLFKGDRKSHWERIHKKKLPNEVSWYQAHPEISLKLISHTKVGFDNNIIDIGGGTSKLVDLLLDYGYKRLTLLDISATAIGRAKSRLGKQSEKVKWIEADITKFNFTEKYDIWHDRAVFHFLTDVQDQKQYINAVNQSLNSEGNLIIATFGLEGPHKCSGLNIVRYSPESLHKKFGNNYKLMETIDEVHVTPSQVHQKFIYCRFKKVREVNFDI